MCNISIVLQCKRSLIFILVFSFHHGLLSSPFFDSHGVGILLSSTAGSGDPQRVPGAPTGPCEESRLAGVIRWHTLWAAPVPSRVPAVPLPGVWGLCPSWASGWPEQHTRWALLGAPLIGREGMHLSPV